MKNKFFLLVAMTLVLMLGMINLSEADTYDVLVDSSVNTLVGTTAIQVKNSTSLCTEFKIWDDSLTFDIIVYLGDPTDSNTMYYTIPGGTVGHVDYMVKQQKDEGIYIKTTVTAGVTAIDYVSIMKKGYK